MKVKAYTLFSTERSYNLLHYLPVSYKDEPGSGAPVHLGQVVFDPVVLLSPTHKVVLCAHHHKVDLTVVKGKPGLVETVARHGEAEVVRDATFSTRIRVIEDPRTESTAVC